MTRLADDMDLLVSMMAQPLSAREQPWFRVKLAELAGSVRALEAAYAEARPGDAPSDEVVYLAKFRPPVLTGAPGGAA